MRNESSMTIALVWKQTELELAFFGQDLYDYK